MSQDLLVVFPTTHLTLMAEKAFRGAGIKHRTIMKPRKISSDCGLAITVEKGQVERVQALLEDSGHLPATFYGSGAHGWECLIRLDRPGEEMQ
jgi:hypothetical protein